MTKRTEFDESRLVADVESGRSVVSIADEYGVSPSSVRRALTRLGYDPVTAPFRTVADRCPELADAEWLRLQHVEFGWGVGAIARRFRVSTTAVMDALRRAGIEPQSGEPQYNDERLRDPAWLADRYRQVPATVIARELGVSYTTVDRALKRYGIPKNPAWKRTGNRHRFTPD